MDKSGVQCLEADLNDVRTLHEPLDMVDVVYNLASPPPGRPQSEYDRFNGESLRNLLRESNEHGVKAFVHLSTLDVYGFRQKNAIEMGTPTEPLSGYQSAKLESERIISEFAKKESPEMKVRIVRASKAIGSRDVTVVTPLLKMIEKGKVVLPSGSGRKMSFSHPKDIAQALLRSSSRGGIEPDIHLVKSFDASLEEISLSLIGESGRRTTISQQGAFSGRTLVQPYAAEQIKAGLTLSDNLRPSWEKIGYAPSYGPDAVRKDIMEWYRKEPWITEDLA